MSWFDRIKVYDLTQPISDLTPPWPTYEPLQIKFWCCVNMG
jgi:kynurenine formamidase